MSTAASTLEKALELYNYLMPLLIFSGIPQMSDVAHTVQYRNRPAVFMATVLVPRVAARSLLGPLGFYGYTYKCIMFVYVTVHVKLMATRRKVSVPPGTK